MTCGGGVRTLLSGDPIILSTETEREELENPILNKAYFCLESKSLYIYNNGSWYTNTITVDSEMSNTSTNPVQNKIINNEINLIKNSIVSLDKIYPIGSIYMSINDTSPASLFGGTWESIKDRFLLGSGTTYTNGSTGGASTVTLTVNQIPSHTHKLSTSSTYNTEEHYTTDYLALGKHGDTYYSNSNAITSTGGGSSHNNMPPYLTVNMWKRIA